MTADWHCVAFPLILPWREEFWTLPLYFPHLRVGVTQGWPARMPYQGMPLPPEVLSRLRELKGYKPGDLLQRQAFGEYRKAQAEEDDLLRELRHYGRMAAPQKHGASAAEAWSLAWQLEKLQADQEAQLQLVERGEDWLKDILAPEPWEEAPGFSPVPGVPETVDPELAGLRYHLWKRVMAPHLQDPWVPLLLGRTARSLFLTLKDWPSLPALKTVRFSLPGCRSAEEWSRVCGDSGAPPWQEEVGKRLQALLDQAGDLETLEAATVELVDFVGHTVAGSWPFPAIWNFDLEVWRPDSPEEPPVLCWLGAGAGVLPG
jgi:hypothetical protein